MNFKKKRSFADLLLAALVILLFVGVPVWLLMVVLITGSYVVCICMMCYVSVAWRVARRFE